MKQYLSLMEDILDFGARKDDRTGTGTHSVFGSMMRFDLRAGFPLVTTKKIFLRGVIHELLWFLKGETNLKYLLDNGVHIWDSWVKPGTAVYRTLEESERFELLCKKLDREMAIIKVWGEMCLKEQENANLLFEEYNIPEKVLVDGELGPIYGQQWRRWEDVRAVQTSDIATITRLLAEGYKKVCDGSNGSVGYIVYRKEHDQIQNMLDILKNDPDSRRIICNSWNPSCITEQALTPCHQFFQLWTRKLSINERCNWLKEALTAVQSEGCLTLVCDDWMSRSEHTDEQVAEFEKYLTENKVPERGISLLFHMRSNDLPVGNPFNVASYALLLMMFAQQVNMVPEEVIYQSGDTHVYDDQVELLETQIRRTPHALPTMNINKAKDLFSYTIDDFKLEGYECDPAIKYPVAI